MTQAVISEASGADWREAALEDEPPPWERWYDRALEEGLDEDLASLGRSVMCEARLQRWDEERAAECGWLDDGEGMLELAQLEPERAHARWRALLDGEA
jgi:hypothetical protein